MILSTSIKNTSVIAVPGSQEGFSGTNETGTKYQVHFSRDISANTQKCLEFSLYHIIIFEAILIHKKKVLLNGQANCGSKILNSVDLNKTYNQKVTITVHACSTRKDRG